uniref:Uncharacterized protein n=1 Tax=Oryza glumipatula TaxID=40148 RepID=A0A0E0ARC9_9ORYZ
MNTKFINTNQNKNHHRTNVAPPAIDAAYTAPPTADTRSAMRTTAPPTTDAAYVVLPTADTGSATRTTAPPAADATETAFDGVPPATDAGPAMETTGSTTGDVVPPAADALDTSFPFSTAQTQAGGRCRCHHNEAETPPAPSSPPPLPPPKVSAIPLLRLRDPPLCPHDEAEMPLPPPASTMATACRAKPASSPPSRATPIALGRRRRRPRDGGCPLLPNPRCAAQTHVAPEATEVGQSWIQTTATTTSR